MDIKIKSPSRDDEIIEIYSSGSTMQKIAEVYGISRQRVEQILRKGGVPRVGSGRRAVRPTSFLCKECGKGFESTVLRRKYCSPECSHLGRRKYKTEEERKARKTELKEYYSMKSREYYREVFKRKSNWKEIIRERNSRSLKKKHAKQPTNQHS